MAVTADDATAPFLQRPYRRLLAELYCLALVFTFHEKNNNTKKVITWALTATVLPVILGASFGVAEPPNTFYPLTALWGAIVAKMHDFEIYNFAGVDFSTEEQSDE